MKSYYNLPVISKISGTLYAVLFICFLLTQISFAQKESYQFELFTASLEGTKLSVITPDENLVLEKEFFHPFSFISDLDEDDVQELLIIDSIQTNGNTGFILYVFNTIDSFYLADSINSGLIFPYETFSGEIEGLIIVTGNNDFSYLNKESEIKAIPINCWKFEDGEIFYVNEELYDIFITENETVLSSIDLEDINHCVKSTEMKSLLATVYINSLNAGEKASAENFLKTFYLCEDIEKFKEELDSLFYKEN
ncbi:MAG: hypothetical protein A2V93_06510 [Ignavibacteria bacterium RBG_16_34_14]|nr:MAG: hypothetical protein A2V93_06510 [Ignavibacteria bacterium RBG_16_34_14]